jgi:hypothetical protein
MVAVTSEEVSDAKLVSMDTGGPVSTATEAFEAPEADTAPKGPTGTGEFTIPKADVDSQVSTAPEADVATRKFTASEADIATGGSIINEVSVSREKVGATGALAANMAGVLCSRL